MPTKRQWMNRLTAGQSALAMLSGGEDENIENAMRAFELEKWSEALKIAPLAKGMAAPLGFLISQAAADMMRNEDSSKVEVVRK